MRLARRAAEPVAFAAFWAIYPRKVARAAALKAWVKIDPTSELIQLIQAALIAQRAELLAREPDKIPHAATWLHGERWNDSIETPRPPNGAEARSARNVAVLRNFMAKGTST